MNAKPFKILCWFDYKCNTGFATVSKNIVPALRAHFGKRMGMDIIAINYIQNDENGVAQPGEQIFEDDKHTLITPAINENFKDGKGEHQIDELGRHEFLSRLYSHDYDLVFIINDIGVLSGNLQPDGEIKGNILGELKNLVIDKKAENKKVPKFVWYFPIDTTPEPWRFQDFDVINVPVVYTEYGRKEVFKVHPKAKGKLRVIPHGTNTKDFYPIIETYREQFREDYFEDNASKFIFCNINRNQPRKDIPTTIFGFEEYLRNHATAPSFLYLHMSPDDSLGWNLRKLLSKTSLVEGKDYMFPKKEIGDTGIELLNNIYNACDCFITTTSGEGYGLSVSESMATKLPVIIPNHTSLTEIGGGYADKDGICRNERAWFLEEFRPYVNHFDNEVRQQCDYREVAEAMLDMYENVISARNDQSSINRGQAHRERVNRAYEWAINLTWDRVNQKWIEIFEQLL